MGGNLAYKNDKSKPKFIFKASKDPRGNKIEKFQIVKGWLDENGQPKEKVFTVMETYDGKGQDNFVGIWGDPDFNINQEAFIMPEFWRFPARDGQHTIKKNLVFH